MQHLYKKIKNNLTQLQDQLLTDTIYEKTYWEKPQQLYDDN